MTRYDQGFILGIERPDVLDYLRKIYDECATSSGILILRMNGIIGMAIAATAEELG
jgi:CheY-like chemotaxis protein